MDARRRDADIMRGRAWEIARKLDEGTKGLPPARDLTATATDDGITIEMQCGATILAVHLSPDEWDDFRHSSRKLMSAELRVELRRVNSDVVGRHRAEATP